MGSGIIDGMGWMGVVAVMRLIVITPGNRGAHSSSAPDLMKLSCVVTPR